MKALEHFIRVYNQLDKHNLATLRTIYSDDICFRDPIHQISGIEALINYFIDLYQNVDTVTFDFRDVISDSSKATVTWLMTVRHPSLNKGKSFSVEGISCLHFNAAGKVCYHRDYFDLGALLYERIPLLGLIITKIKERLAS